MRILLLNQYLPPSAAPTAALIGDVAAALEAKGHEVHLVGARREYTSGRTGAGRLLFEAGDLLWMGLQLVGRSRPDLIFCLTSPPGLVVVAALGAAWHRCRLRHWVMDVYPGVAMADGLLREGLVAGLLGMIFQRACARCERIMVLDEDMARVVAHGYGGPIAVQAPWPQELSGHSAFPGWPGVPDGGPVWLYSGNLGRAHLWEPLVRAQERIEAETDDIHLVLQGGGAGWNEAREEIRRRDLKRAHTCGPVPREQLAGSLLRAQAHVASQAPAMRGLIWPSKLALLTELEAPLFWLGGPGSGIARQLEALPNARVFEPHQAEALADAVIAAIRSGQKKVQEINYLQERIQSVRRRSIQHLIDWMEC